MLLCENPEASTIDDIKCQHNLLVQAANNVAAERDQWKARAVALESAMKELAGCAGCVHEQVNYYSEPCKSCKDSRPDWQFDQERFTKED